jgi:8-oxo-dGTP pyrophosphatase MutT (NUDIX family)
MLLNELQDYKPAEEMERRSVAQFLAMLRDNGETAFYRDCFTPGHVTGSALLISRDGSRVLMNHHKSLNKWLCFGGHADGDMDVLNVALRETIEESGIQNVVVRESKIADVDVHLISRNEKKNEPPHFHFDVRYILYCNDNEDFVMSEESNDLRWCTYDEAMGLLSDYTMKRLLTKWKNT